jgi:type I restriction enzyme M protein
MNPNTAEIVAKLWREAKTLQGAGISIMHYVNELTYLLFLKMLEETGQTAMIPPAYSWSRAVQGRRRRPAALLQEAAA